MPKVSAIVLAAGLSRRMGSENKLFLPVQGKPMLLHGLEQIERSNIQELIVVTSERSIAGIPENYQPILNPDYEKGMTTSIQKGVAAATASNGYMICLGDQPTIKTEDYDQIIRAFDQAYAKDTKSIVVPFHEGKRGNPVIFSASYKTEILNHQNMEGCKGIIQENAQHIVRVSLSNAGILTDIDTPEDYRNSQDLFF